MPRLHKRTYEVGFRKPPKHTQFKKGQSGNPKGRPKGSKNLASLLRQAINERVSVVEHGRRKTITKGEAALKQLVNKAASGDPKAIKLLIELDHYTGAFDQPDEGAPTPPVVVMIPSNGRDPEIEEAFFQRQREYTRKLLLDRQTVTPKK